jgi:hypothetical protein
MSMMQTCIEYVENNKIIIALVIAVAAYLWYTKVYEGMKNSEKVEEVGEEESFKPSKEFVGEKKGFVFKEGVNGLGYYRDN